MTLEEFASYLSGQGMIDAARLKDDGDEGFENRLKVQKYVFLAKHFGLDLGYVYSIHLHGPYSRRLTSDYYKLDVMNTAASAAPPTLRHKEFMSVLETKSADWLEIAATIIHETSLDKDVRPRHLYVMKCDHRPEFIDSVYHDLTEIGML